MGHPNNELFLSQKEQELFKEVQNPLGYLNLSIEEREAIRSSSNNCNIVIKKARKGPCVVIWNI